VQNRIGNFAVRHPRLAALLGAVTMIVILAIDVPKFRQARYHLAPHAWRSALFVGVAVGIAFVVIVRMIMARWIRGPAAAVVGTVLFLSWAAGFVALHPRFHHQNVSFDSSTRVITATATDIPLVALSALCLVGAVSPRAAGGGGLWGRPPAPPPPPTTPEGWHVVDSGPKPAFDPYFVAHCDCNWVGPPQTGRDAERDAFADARAHTPNVRAAVVNPLG
jgi:hypothetical protein